MPHAMFSMDVSCTGCGSDTQLRIAVWIGGGGGMAHALPALLAQAMLAAPGALQEVAVAPVSPASDAPAPEALEAPAPDEAPVTEMAPASPSPPQRSSPAQPGNMIEAIPKQIPWRQKCDRVRRMLGAPARDLALQTGEAPLAGPVRREISSPEEFSESEEEEDAAEVESVIEVGHFAQRKHDGGNDGRRMAQGSNAQRQRDGDEGGRHMAHGSTWRGNCNDNGGEDMESAHGSGWTGFEDAPWRKKHDYDKGEYKGGYSHEEGYDISWRQGSHHWAESASLSSHSWHEGDHRAKKRRQ